MRQALTGPGVPQLQTASPKKLQMAPSNQQQIYGLGLPSTSLLGPTRRLLLHNKILTLAPQ